MEMHPKNPITVNVSAADIASGKFSKMKTEEIAKAKANGNDVVIFKTPSTVGNEIAILDPAVVGKQQSPKEFLSKWREARTAIAKSYDVESSLDPTTRKVSGSRLSQLLTEGRPLTGGLKDLAEVGGEFPEAMKSPRDQDYFTHRVTPMAMTHPEAAASHWATRLWDPITLSKIYQSAFVDPSKKLSPEQQRLLRFTAAAQQANRPGQIDAPPE
jgi:hypothetical protein